MMCKKLQIHIVAAASCGGSAGGDSGGVTRWLLVGTSRRLAAINLAEVFIFMAVLTRPSSYDWLYLILCWPAMNRLIEFLLRSSQLERSRFHFQSNSEDH